MVIAHLLIPVYGRELSRWVRPEEFMTVTALLTLVFILCLEGGTAPELRLTSRPVQSWGWWVRLACGFGLVIAVISVVVVGFLWAIGRPMPIPRASPSALPARLFAFCVFAPVVEELIYRGFLTQALAGTMGTWGLIVTSGVVFGLLHVLYGNPGPDNLVAGFFLQWAFLKSGSILVPMAMHAAGNALAVTSHVVNWHLFPVGVAS